MKFEPDIFTTLISRSSEPREMRDSVEKDVAIFVDVRVVLTVIFAWIQIKRSQTLFFMSLYSGSAAFIAIHFPLRVVIEANAL